MTTPLPPEPKPVEKAGERLEERARQYVEYCNSAGMSPKGDYLAGLTEGLKQGEEERETFLAEHDENVRLHTELLAERARSAALVLHLERIRDSNYAIGSTAQSYAAKVLKEAGGSDE